jgi:hypothetical protein
MQKSILQPGEGLEQFGIQSPSEENSSNIIKWRTMGTILESSPDELTFRHSGTPLEMRWAFFSIASLVITRDGIKKPGPVLQNTELMVSVLSQSQVNNCMFR